MSAVYPPSLPRLAVRDSFDDDDLSDVDDEVFIRDGRNGGLKIDDESGVKRPLMAPRRKCKGSHASDKHGFPCRALVAPCCYGILALLVLLGLIIFVIFAVSVFPVPLAVLKKWLTRGIEDSVNSWGVAPCTSLATSIVWTRTLPKLTSEAPLRSSDVNGDKIEDIIVGFGTGLDAMDASQSMCTLYFEGQTPCLGGVLALDGATGETIWTHWTTHAILSVDCSLDLTDDNIKDCIISGLGGIMQAVNGHNGSTIWELPLQDPGTPRQERILDVYDAKYIPDADEDAVGDVIASHTTQIRKTIGSDILIISGRTGSVIRKVHLPGEEQLFLAPQTLVHPDGERILVVVTGSQRRSGGLYILPFFNLVMGEAKLRQLHHNAESGELLPPVLVDITSDGTEDIIAAMFNSTIIAYDGRSFEQLWNYTVPNSEIISIPVPGYYNDDDIPDFMVKHHIGPGFPVYYYTVTTIINGKTGKPLLENAMEDSMSGQMSGLSITVDGYGNDWFLHWSADCLNHEGEKSKYQFLKTQSFVSQTRVDLCKLRFNSTLTTKLLALSQHVGPPGTPLYVSDNWKKLEFNNSIDPRREAERYLETHPNYEANNPDADSPLVSERSPRIHKNQRKGSNFRHKENNYIFADQNGIRPYFKDTRTSLNDYENPDNFKDNEGSDLEAKVSDDFSSDDDWRDGNKWEEDTVQSGKDYDGFYNGDIPEISAIREQRSDTNFVRTVNNDTNEVQNQLDPSLDYTNGQSKYNSYYPPEPINRTTDVDGSMDYSDLPDFDFEENETDKVLTNLKEKRKTDEGNNLSLRTDQAEVMMEEVPSDANYVERKDASKTDKNLQGSKQIIERNVQFHDAIEIHPIPETFLDHIQIFSKNSSISKHNADGVSYMNAVQSNVTDRNTDKREAKTNTVKQTAAVDEGDRWLLKNVFAKVMRNDEDANVEKVFKRESMKNRKERKKVDEKKLSMMKGMKKQLQDLRNKRRKREAQSNNDGVQRQPPTGILLPSLAKFGTMSNSVDLVFSTFWLPSEASVILLQQDIDCIHRKTKNNVDANQYQQKDQIISDCLADRGVDLKLYQEATDRENIKIALGQMTIYRMKLECVCPEDILPGQTCKRISEQQSWPAYLGASVNGFFKPSKRPST